MADITKTQYAVRRVFRDPKTETSIGSLATRLEKTLNDLAMDDWIVDPANIKVGSFDILVIGHASFIYDEDDLR